MNEEASEETFYEKPSLFRPGTLIILELEDERTVIGELMSLDKYGIHVLETHRFLKTKEVQIIDEKQLETAVDKLTDKELSRQAKQYRIHRKTRRDATRNELEELLKIKIHEEVEVENEESSKYFTEVVQLVRPIERYVFMKRVFSMSNLQDIIIEQDIRGFRENVKDASSLSTEE